MTHRRDQGLPGRPSPTQIAVRQVIADMALARTASPGGLQRLGDGSLQASSAPPSSPAMSWLRGPRKRP